MAIYPIWARTAARVLEPFPALRQVSKGMYQRARYLWRRKASAVLDVLPGAAVTSFADWAAVREPLGSDWFCGYYDTSPWTRNMEMAVLQSVRGPLLDVLVLDRASSGLRVVGTSRAWNYQQGCRSQWAPGSSDSVVFNDIVDGTLGSWMVAATGKRRRFIRWPIQTLHPAGRFALTLNYRRLFRFRPEYGYSVDVTNFSPAQELDNDGIWSVDMESEKGTLLVSLLDLTRIEARPTMSTAAHKVNHIIYSPNGSRFLFMHRWFHRGRKYSRLYAATAEGKGLVLLMDNSVVSHYHWLDEERLVAWGRASTQGDGYYLIDARSGRAQSLWGAAINTFGDGHPSFSPMGRWMVTDTYPDRARRRHLLLWDSVSGIVTQLASFFAPWRFDGAERCDLHPRWSPDGTLISVDSTHEGVRRSYVVDVSALVEPSTKPAAKG
jgi:hypothetical protein